MTDIRSVIGAEYRGGFRIHVTFDDHSEKTIDFRCWLNGPVFEPLKDAKYFRRFFLDGWTIAWPNGADIAPETLYACDSVTAADPPDKRTRPTGVSGRPRRAARD
jgi:uncharacterized protein DUF2442